MTGLAHPLVDPVEEDAQPVAGVPPSRSGLDEAGKGNVDSERLLNGMLAHLRSYRQISRERQRALITGTTDDDVLE